MGFFAERLVLYPAICYFRIKSPDMKTINQIFLLVVLTFLSCNSVPDSGSMDKWKQEIMDVERDFASMAGEEGIREAFLHYAADEAVLMRNDKLIFGRQQMVEHFGESEPLQDESLTWEPDFVDVSASGDLSYTYGKFVYSYTDSAGISVEHRGIFHTVWKRQADGSWRFVWD
jgi:ketosteroid isomerase-like protein